jgi:hypothetical protein
MSQLTELINEETVSKYADSILYKAVYWKFRNKLNSNVCKGINKLYKYIGKKQWNSWTQYSSAAKLIQYYWTNKYNAKIK